MTSAGDKETLADILNISDPSEIPTNETVNSHIEQANNFVDIYIGSRYQLPLTGEPMPFLVNAAAKIAIYNLQRFARKEFVDDVTREDYNEAIRILEEIRDGKLRLVFPDKDRRESLVEPQRVNLGSNINKRSEREFDRIVREF